MDAFLGAGAVQEAEGCAIEDLLGAELFGPDGALRQALAMGERREGWRASLAVARFPPRLVSVTVAPLRHHPEGVCDPQIAYIVVMRPACDDPTLSPEAPTGFAGVVATSPGMARIFALISNLEQSEATVLLTGESGTGKEVVARAIHSHSPRRNGPFVAVSCGALPGELLESELFGHVRGAFTGAVRDRVGRFELALGGTLFLDEIGDLPLHLQVKLLRVLQERAFERVGDSRTRSVDTRIIAATNVDLGRAVAGGRFREDLYYRLRVVPIEIPPLRERVEDIEPLARSILTRVAERQHRALRFSPSAIRTLVQYSWPGNVRELENAIEYAVAIAQSETILPENLPIRGGVNVVQPPPVAVVRPVELAPATVEPATLEGFEDERAELLRTLDAVHWRRAEAARRLGVSRTTLWRKMREFGIEP
jgi:transcriptional regulator with GAF, ATPase, and Fis domain